MKNELKATLTKVVENEKIVVNISLDDDCNNGHNDFSVTGTLYELHGKRWVWVSSGCIHEEILRFYPTLKPLIDLHLCDDNGVPMYPIANNPYTKFFPDLPKEELIAHIYNVLPELKTKAIVGITMLRLFSQGEYLQSPTSAHLSNELKYTTNG